MGWFKQALALESDVLDHPDVEWQIYERTGGIGNTEWVWSVVVGDKKQSNYEFRKEAAIERARDAARRLLGQGERFGKTRPCPLCGKPSEVGKETDTDECARLLDLARAELKSLPQAQL